MARYRQAALMLRLPIFLTASLLFLSTTGFSQRTTPSPTAEDVVKISTNLIQMDVSVTDRNGKTVSDLKPEDFEVFENGKKQSISSFSFVSDTREREVQRSIKKTTETHLPATAPPPRPTRVGRTIALVVDNISLSWDSTNYVRQTLKKFVDEQIQDGDMVAIIRTGAGIGALQQFTTDKRLLYAAIDRVKWNIIGTGSIGAFAQMEPVGPTEEREGGQRNGGIRTAEGRRKEFEDFQASVFATGTLGAVGYVIRGLQEMSGRKSVVLVSQGFKLYQEDATGFKEGSERVMKALRKLIDQANRASVTIYALDARGVAYTGLTAADDTGNRSMAQIEKELAARRQKMIDTQFGLEYLSKATGGFAVLNQNDLSAGLERIIDDQSYYLIGFVPDDETFDPASPKFNNIEVKLKQPGPQLRYRSGFYGVADNKTASAQKQLRNTLQDALMSPLAVNQITVRLNALFNSSPESGPYLNSLLHVDADQFSFEDLPDGSKKLTFDVLAVVLGDNGTIVDQINKIYSVTVKKDAFENFKREGFVYNFIFPMKKPGVYQLRLALRDQRSQNVGSANQFVEIPDLKKDALVISGVMLANKAGVRQSDALTDTSLRQFRRGTVLNYDFSIFHGKTGTGDLRTQMRLFKDGKLIFAGQPQTISARSVGKSPTPLAGSLVLGKDMDPGDYVMQLNAVDDGGGKKASAVQYVEFEIIG
jgi:VWFA-related protein